MHVLKSFLCAPVGAVLPVLVATFMPVVGCGGDDTTVGEPFTAVDAGPSSDAASENLCPINTPDRDTLVAPCCSRRSNADRLSSPEFRMVNIEVQSPTTLLLSNTLIKDSTERELSSWLLDVDLEGDNATIRIGSGSRDASGSFSFDEGEYPSTTTTGQINGNVLLTDAFPGLIRVPLFDGLTGAQVSTMAVRGYRVELTLSDDRTCAGERRNLSAWTNGGRTVGYTTVADAEADVFSYGPLVDTNTCRMLSGTGNPPGGRCADIPQEDWPTPPDSLCDGGDPEVCVSGMCDPLTECNAWEIESEVSAAGVEIVE